MPPPLPFPVLICENKIPANSCSINTKHLWGQAFTYTAQFLRAGCGPGADNALLAAAWLQCDREGWAEEPSADKLTLTADAFISACRQFQEKNPQQKSGAESTWLLS